MALITPGGGQRFGPWEVLGAIARGGQGAVLRARDPASGASIALKLLLRADDRSQRRFRQEAHVLECLDHPGIVRVRGHGVEDGVPWLAMDLVEGETLRDRVERRGVLEPDEAARLVASLARAVEHAHGRGVVHRDLKPENVILDAASGQPVLVDFGLLRRDAEVFGELSIDAHSRLSHTGELRGTPAYMAPEQVSPTKFGGVAPHTDVYGLGGVLHFLLTGQPPIAADSLPNLIFQLLEASHAPDPARIRPDLPAALCAEVQRALARAPADRHPSAGALADALERGLGGARRRPASSRRRLAFAAVGLAGALLIGALAWMRWRSAEPEPAPSDGGASKSAPDGPRGSLAAVEEALGRTDAPGALAALELARVDPADAAGVRRAAALEAEARWLGLDLEGATRAMRSAGADGELPRALLDAVQGRASFASARLEQAPDRPAIRLARAIARHARDDVSGDEGRVALLLGLVVLDGASAAEHLDRFVQRTAEWWAADRAGLEVVARARREGADRAALVLVARARVATLAGEVGLESDAKTTLAGYRRALVPLRWLLLLEPASSAASFPPELLELAGRLRVLPLPEVDQQLASAGKEARRAYYQQRNRRGSAEFEATLRALRERAATRAGRRELSHFAADLLVDEGDPRYEDSLAWTDEFLVDATHEDHEVLVVRCIVLSGLQRHAEALPLLDRIIEDDPLHGDARERRAHILNTLGRGPEAEAELLLSIFDPGRDRHANMRGPRDPYAALARWQKARGDVAAAIATCEAGLRWARRHERSPGRLERTLADLRASPR